MENKEYDVIVIGAGNAGLVSALTLQKKGNHKHYEFPFAKNVWHFIICSVLMPHSLFLLLDNLL